MGLKPAGGIDMAQLIRGGQVFNSARNALERSDVLIEADRIVAVGPDLATPTDAHTLDATGYLVLPGLINAHTHAHNNLLKGMANN
jgi:cytosine/adenosine deaminase-related metal-dependent hydrolase